MRWFHPVTGGVEGWSGKTEPGIMCDISFELHSRLRRVTIIAVLQLRSLGRLVGVFLVVLGNPSQIDWNNNLLFQVIERVRVNGMFESEFQQPYGGNPGSLHVSTLPSRLSPFLRLNPYVDPRWLPAAPRTLCFLVHRWWEGFVPAFPARILGFPLIGLTWVTWLWLTPWHGLRDGMNWLA